MVSAVVPVIAGDTFIFSGENKNSFNGLPAIMGYKTEQTISSNKATDILIWDENLSFENKIITITEEMVEAGVKYISACAIGNSDDLPTLKKRL